LGQPFHCSFSSSLFLTLFLLFVTTFACVPKGTVESTVAETILVAGEFKLDSEGLELVSHEVNNRQPACFCPSQAGDIIGSLGFLPPFGSTCVLRIDV
jgi:hypothetical protein